MANVRCSNILLFLTTVLICLAAGEVAVRFAVVDDGLGNLVVGGTRLLPYAEPLDSMSKALEHYESTTAPLMIHDPELGWVFPPCSSAQKGGCLVHYDADSLRSGGLEYATSPAPGTLRIAIFGDSFTHGDEVSFANTWGQRLETMLRREGMNAEVLNFGVSGYGVDQAYLRYRKTGARYGPHLVILGFMPRDVARNLNMIRALFAPGTRKFLFSKPRFILDGEELRLINSPAMDPADTIRTIGELSSWDLADHEAPYGRFYRDRFIYRSRLLAFLAGRVAVADRGSEFALDGEAATLTLAIIERFRQDVESAGGTFLVVTFPMRRDVAGLVDGRGLAHEDLLGAMAETTTVIQTEALLAGAAARSSVNALFRPRGHYSAAGNRIVARELARWIRSGDVDLPPTPAVESSPFLVAGVHP